MDNIFRKQFCQDLALRFRQASAVCLVVGAFATPLLSQTDNVESESYARPPVIQADLQIAKRAHKILDSPSKWNRADTRTCPSGARTLSLYCAIEKATDEVGGNFQHRGAAMQEARFVIEDISPKGKSYDHRLMDYNNDPSTRFEDIQKVLRLLETRIQRRLKEESPAVIAATVSLSRVSAMSPVELQIVQRAQEILNSPSKWNRADDQTCPPTDSVSFFCAFQRASRQVTGSFNLVSSARKNRSGRRDRS